MSELAFVLEVVADKLEQDIWKLTQPLGSLSPPRQNDESTLPVFLKKMN